MYEDEDDYSDNEEEEQPDESEEDSDAEENGGEEEEIDEGEPSIVLAFWLIVRVVNERILRCLEGDVTDEGDEYINFLASKVSADFRTILNDASDLNKLHCLLFMHARKLRWKTRTTQMTRNWRKTSVSKRHSTKLTRTRRLPRFWQVRIREFGHFPTVDERLLTFSTLTCRSFAPRSDVVSRSYELSQPRTSSKDSRSNHEGHIEPIKKKEIEYGL